MIVTTMAPLVVEHISIFPRNRFIPSTTPNTRSYAHMIQDIGTRRELWSQSLKLEKRIVFVFFVFLGCVCEGALVWTTQI